MAPKTILIKKYENRRLYDATNSRYINLEEVAQILRRGDEVKVVDAVSGEDITRLILTQIIVDGAKAPDSNFPLDILRDMVIASGRASQESAIRYTRAMLDLYKSSFQSISPALNPFEFMQGAASSGRDANDSSTKAGPEKRDVVVEDDAEGLKHRVAELERLVSRLRTEKPAKGSSGKPTRLKRRK